MARRRLSAAVAWLVARPPASGDAAGHDASARCPYRGVMLLSADPARPERFHHMPRVFRPGSALRLRAWILAVSEPSSGTVVLAGFRDDIGPLGRGAGQVLLATYTAPLLSTTAISVWNGARRTLPLVLAAAGLSSAAALLELVSGDGAAPAALLRRLSMAGKLGELAAMRALEREVGDGPAGAPLIDGSSKELWMLAKGLTLGSLVAAVFPGSGSRRLEALLSTAGALALRFAVAEADKAAARDARAVFVEQRASS